MCLDKLGQKPHEHRTVMWGHTGVTPRVGRRPLILPRVRGSPHAMAIAELYDYGLIRGEQRMKATHIVACILFL